MANPQQLGDYTGMIGFYFRGCFYKLEEFLEHHISETESLNRKIKELYRSMEEAKTYIDSKVVPPLNRKMRVIETKAFSKIDKFSGDAKQSFRQWMIPVINLLCSVETQSREILKKVELQNEVIDLDAYIDYLDIDGFAADILLMFTLTMTGEALAIVENCDGNGPEAWRQLCKEYDAKTPQNLQALLTSIIQPARVKDIDNVSAALNNWETRLREYVLRGGKDLEEGLKVCAVRAIIPKDMDDIVLKMALHTRGYSVLKSYLQEQVQSHRNSGLMPMQINSAESANAQATNSCNTIPDLANIHVGEEGIPIDAIMKGKGKGKGKGGKGGKGKGKAGGKGGAPANNAQFQGYCGYCWNWGHKRIDCRSRIRNGGGQQQQAMDVNEVSTGSDEEMALACSLDEICGDCINKEICGDYINREICGDYINKEICGDYINDCGGTSTCATKAKHVTFDMKATNITHVLDACKSTQARRKMPRAHSMNWVKYGQVASLEDETDQNVLHTISPTPVKMPMIKIEATIDSGASHSFAPPEAVPGVPVNESAGSRKGQHYVAAGGDHPQRRRAGHQVCNRRGKESELEVAVRTDQQATAVCKPHLRRRSRDHFQQGRRPHRQPQGRESHKLPTPEERLRDGHGHRLADHQPRERQDGAARSQS